MPPALVVVDQPESRRMTQTAKNHGDMLYCVHLERCGVGDITCYIVYLHKQCRWLS